VRLREFLFLVQQSSGCGLFHLKLVYTGHTCHESDHLCGQEVTLHCLSTGHTWNIISCGMPKYEAEEDNEDNRGSRDWSLGVRLKVRKIAEEIIVQDMPV
jgi:hypothetical protein